MWKLLFSEKGPEAALTQHNPEKHIFDTMVAGDGVSYGLSFSSLKNRQAWAFHEFWHEFPDPKKLGVVPPS